ncbi:MAG: hypothetical protein HY010_07690 [Acidobacteria bacterium]|nr:hypothetical protein [Acidobacteriota bacterium]
MPTRWSNSRYSTQIFYTISASSGIDSVTATFATRLSQFGIIYAHEYTGIRATAPIDVTAAAVGTSGSLSSGSATTLNDNDLLFAGGVSANRVTGAGAGYTARSNAQANITEDRVVSVKGSYSATASNSGGAWAMQLVAFKGLAAGDTTPPTVPTGLNTTVLSPTQINLSWNASSDPDNPSSQLSYSIYRNGTRVSTTAAGVISWTDSGLSPSTTYTYTVSAADPAGNVSAQSAPVQATTPPASDTTPPTVPANLALTGTTASTVSLAWNASTDNVGVAGYKIFRSGTQVGSTGAVSYTDTGLAASTTYSYTVSAFDATGNNSAQSAPVSATTATPDTQAPTVSITSPANNQTVSGAFTITANAADNVGVVGVQFQLDGNSLGAENPSPPYSITWDTTQTANGSHVLTAVARDAAGNKTSSSPVTVTINNNFPRPYSTTFPLTESPISEGGNWMSAMAGTRGNLWSDVYTSSHFAYGPALPTQFGDPTAMLAGSWTPDQSAQATVRVVTPHSDCCHEVEIRLRTAMGPNSITGYEINCSVATANPYVQAVRWNGPNGDFTYIGSANTNCVDGDVLNASIIGSTISVYKNGILLFIANDSTFTSGAPGIGFYQAGSGNFNDFGFSSFTASDGSTNDTSPPSVPANLAASPFSPSEIDLAWTASTDNVGVAGYQVFRDNVPRGTSTTASFSDKTVFPNIQYTYAVSAFDAAGNVSDQSSPVVAQTSFGSDTTPPSVPANLQTSKVTSTTLTLTWSASTDNVAVAGYWIFRNGAQVGTITTATSFVDTGLTPSTTYSYTIAAYDTSNNVSAQSQSITVTTAPLAMTPPSIVQVNQNQIASGSSTSVTFNTPTVAGNTIVVYVIWNNAGNVTVTDSRGNTFVSVSAPVIWSSGNSAQIFYASGIAGGADTVTAAFRTPVTNFGVVYVHEYAGISVSSPVDLTASATGSSGSLNSGAITTTGANELIFGAGVSDNSVTAVGSGFSSRDLAYGNVTEDQVAASIGSYAATATHNGRIWGIQVVAFRPAQ